MKKIITIAAIVLLGLVSNSQAANTTNTTKSTATLAASCQVLTNDIDFGVITPATSGSTDKLGSLQVLCTKQSSYQIVLSLGLNGNRTLKGVNKGQFIYYSLCQAPGWSNSGNSSCTNGYWLPGYPRNGTGTGALQTHTIYAYVPNGFYVPDSYTDTTTVTVSF